MLKYNFLKFFSKIETQFTDNLTLFNLDDTMNESNANAS